MKYAQDVNAAVVLYEIRNSKMPEQQYAYMARGSDVAISDFRESDQVLSSLVDALNGSTGSFRVV